MKMQEALEIIDGSSAKPKGFRVSFELAEEGMLKSDFFPDRNEPLIETETEAWLLANAFAKQTYGHYVNIYVTNDEFSPVQGYEKRKIINREE